MSTASLGQSQIPTDPKTGEPLWFCEKRGGMFMCIPLFSDVLGWFRGVQRAFNDLARRHNWGPIAVDGRIGPKTTSAVMKAFNAIPEAMRGGFPAPTSPEHVAFYATELASLMAAAAGTEPNFNPAQGSGERPGPTPTELQPTQPPPDQRPLPQPIPPGEDDKPSRTWLWIVIGAVAVLGVTGVGYYLWRRSKGKPLFGALGEGNGGGGAMEESQDYDDEPPPEFGDVIDV